MRQQKQAETLAALGARYGNTETITPPGAGGTPPTAAGTVANWTGGTDPYGRAIASIESGGSYNKLGPVIPRTGDRAYGKYQVMGQNVPEWTQAALGRAMTPQEFLKDTIAQELVFKHRFGNYVQKYGPSGAARAWFAGEGGMNNPGASDPLGTTVSEYERRFNAGVR